MDSFREIIGRWPSRSAFGDDVGAKPGTVRMWHTRDFIPPEFWAAAVRAAASRQIDGVTAETMATLAARRRTGAAAPLPEPVPANG